MLKIGPHPQFLTLCLLCNFASFLSSAIFFQNQLFEKPISNAISVKFGSRWGHTFVGPDQESKMFAQGISRQHYGKELTPLLGPGNFNP